MFGIREAQLPEEDGGHGIVEMLPGVDQAFVDLRHGRDRAADRGSLDELRASPDHRGDF